MEYPQDISNWPKVEVYGIDFRTELLNIANTITKLELWSWMKNESPPPQCGYMRWTHPNIDMISANLPVNNHSGATFAIGMRNIEAIAKKGFTEWKNTYTT